MAKRRCAGRSRPVVRGSVQADRVIVDPRAAEAVEECEPEQLSFDF